jgi:hypothetical protein
MPNTGVTNQEIEVGEYNKYSPHPWPKNPNS